MSDRKFNVVFVAVILNAVFIKLILPLVSETYWQYVSVYIFAYIIPATVSIFAGRYHFSSTQITFTSIKSRYVRDGALVFISLVIFSFALNLLFPNNAVSHELSLSSFALSGILAPILEEFFWRGTVFGLLSRYGTVQAMIISSLFFAMMHKGSAGLMYACFGGMLFACLYVRTGSLLPCIVIHLANNTISLVSTVYPWVLFAAIICAAILLLVLRSNSTSDSSEFFISTHSVAILKSPLLYITLAILAAMRYFLF